MAYLLGIQIQDWGKLKFYLEKIIALLCHLNFFLISNL